MLFLTRRRSWRGSPANLFKVGYDKGLVSRAGMLHLPIKSTWRKISAGKCPPSAPSKIPYFRSTSSTTTYSPTTVAAFFYSTRTVSSDCFDNFIMRTYDFVLPLADDAKWNVVNPEWTVLGNLERISWSHLSFDGQSTSLFSMNN